MREQLERPRRAPLIFLPGKRLHERTHVADDRQLLFGPERLHFYEARVQTERITDAERSDREQTVARNAEPRGVARRGIRVVLSGRRRHDHIVPVVAPRQEDADQRLVVRSLRQQVDEAEALNACDERGRPERIADACLPGLQKEFATCDGHGYLST